MKEFIGSYSLLRNKIWIDSRFCGNGRHDVLVRSIKRRCYKCLFNLCQFRYDHQVLRYL